MATQTEEQEERYQRILDIEQDASQQEIERQYSRLRKLYQPDKLDDADDRAYAEGKLAELEEAYTALVGPEHHGHEPEVVDEEEVLFCANHPNRETLLRCNKCGKPICMECAVQTPVGYRCRECVYEQQNVYFNAASSDNLIALGVGFLVSAFAAPIVGLLIGRFGFFGLIIAFIAGSGAGSILAQIIRRAVGRRRGRRLPIFALTGILLGILVGNLAFLIVLGAFPLFSLPMLLFTGLAIAAAYPQLK